MNLKKNPWIAFVLVIVLLASGVCGFFAGKKSAEAEYQAERELNIMLNRSDLEGLGEIKGPFYVTGHKVPDADTVGCAIAYAELLQKLGYDARPVVLGEINNETKYILDAAKLDTPELLADAAGCNLILVDHSEVIQSADGLENARVLTIIDHHGDGTVTTGNQLVYDARPFGSAATIVWMRYRNYGIEPDPQTALVLMGAVLSDTNNLHSFNTTFADREALKALSGLAGVTDVDAFYQEMYRASISYEGMSDLEIFYSDYREYESGGIKYGIGCVSVYDEEGAKEMAERMKDLLPATVNSAGVDMSFAEISVFHDDLSITYIVPSDEVAAIVIEGAFGDRAVFDGTSYVFRPGVSRRQDVVPAITGFLESKPKK